MDFDLSEEQRLLKDSVDGLLKGSYNFDSRKKYRADREFKDVAAFFNGLAKELADLSDPLLDVLAQRHAERDRPLFVS